MTIDYTYSFFRVSKSEEIYRSAQKYRDLRLQALQVSPGSFASTYETESAFTDNDWISRLTDPGYEIFISAATSPHYSLSEPEWVGQVTLRGPASSQDFTLPAASCQPPQKSDSEEERWQMLSLFTLPEHRGNRLGANLCREALDYLRNYRLSPPSIHVRLMVRPENQVAVKLYRRLGFIAAGNCNLSEALVANGDGYLLPKDLSATKWSTRTGLIMSLWITRH
ncbi:uncharacterized protein N7483_011164 [Penicillium malachiteum]|uniref:uncharacterized protein n=1 Tax=Penicillium malachiteum TaxID=1324776 RepID=UPI002547185C|nr:uncharacterized protein N7483_011164 [Penicillium malachiteum]KAJ5713983.1 hypothetical protein N7483_011164 [Penicillium malachiteum]